ncbi:MAG: hypothetical protein HKO02_15605 [Hyphomonadaceae bacterium]|nr:hypothetical protein [Hyphomonadaceae bacterium]
MLLRSLTKHVRDQNWLAVFLDFFIVVVGILIAFQITNWNEERAENDLANRYIQHLIADIRSDIADIETGFRTSEWRLAALTELLEKSDIPTIDKSYNPERELTTPRVSATDNSITNLMNASSYTRFLDYHSPTYVSLVNCGNARLISKLKPWPCIQSYYAQYHEVQLFEERLLLLRTELLRAQHDAGISLAGNLPEEETLDRIRNNAPVAAAMSTNRLWVYYHMDVLEELGQRAALLLEALKTNSARCDVETGSL